MDPIHGAGWTRRREMTIALALKVGDGLVLAADSATTLMEGNIAYNWWFNAEKVFNVVKGLPIGVVTAGAASLGGRSINSLAKDLREQLTDPEHARYLDPNTYTVQQVAERIKGFFFDELYLRDHANKEPGKAPTIHFLVGGYCAHIREPEVWSVDVDNSQNCTVACQLPPQLSGAGAWRGQGEAIDRILRGYSTQLYEHMVALGITPADAIRLLTTLPNPPLMHPGMPIQDVIDLARYLLNATSDFVRFSPGPPTVHGPFDIATITPHEHFRWVQRKHFFDRRLNRPIDRYEQNSRNHGDAHVD